MNKRGGSLPNWAYRGMCCQKGYSFWGLYKVFTILLLDFLNKKCFWKLWITLKQASVIYMNILLVTEWSCYAKINNKFLIIKGGGRKRILFLSFLGPNCTPLPKLCVIPLPPYYYTVYTTQWALGVWIFLCIIFTCDSQWKSSCSQLMSDVHWGFFCSILSFYQCGCVSHSKHIYMGTCMKLLLLIKFFIFIIFFRKRLTTKQILASMNTAMWLVTLQNLKRMREFSRPM